MRENRPYGSEGGETGSTGLPYPYRLRPDPYFPYDALRFSKKQF